MKARQYIFPIVILVGVGSTIAFPQNNNLAVQTVQFGIERSIVPSRLISQQSISELSDLQTYLNQQSVKMTLSVDQDELVAVQEQKSKNASEQKQSISVIPRSRQRESSRHWELSAYLQHQKPSMIEKARAVFTITD